MKIMKTYNSPMLNVVSIKRSDIIATSGEKFGITNTAFDTGSGTILGADRFRDDWDAGY